MCVDMWVDMYVVMCVDMRADTCVGMCVDLRVDTCVVHVDMRVSYVVFFFF